MKLPTENRFWFDDLASPVSNQLDYIWVQTNVFFECWGMCNYPFIAITPSSTLTQTDYLASQVSNKFSLHPYSIKHVLPIQHRSPSYP